MFAFLGLNAELAVCDNGKIGRFSSGSTQLIIVVPEHLTPLSVSVDNNIIVACGYFSKDLTFLSVNGASEETLSPLDRQRAANLVGCKSGETYVAHSPPALGKDAGATIFVPSSAL